MKFLVFFTILQALVFLIFAESNKKCFQDLSLSTIESDVTKEVLSIIESKQQNVSIDCLNVLIERGYFKAALDLYEGYFMVEKIDVFEQVRNATNIQKKNFSKFTSAFEIANSQVQQLRPVIQWAQSRDSVFIYMKKALRKDAPGCIDCVKEEKIEITDEKLFATSFGIITHAPVRWVLDMELFDKINPETSSWQEQGVGIITFNLTKAVNGTLWEKLEKETDKQAQIWWDMRDKYKKDMDDWIKMVDKDYTKDDDIKDDDDEAELDGENKNDGENKINEEKNNNYTNNNSDTQPNKTEENQKQNTENDQQIENNNNINDDEKKQDL